MVIVIGASGFIGTYLVRRLVKDGYEVLATGRNPKAKDFYNKLNIKYIELDLRNKKDFDKLPTDNIEGVFLLAGLLPANIENENPYDYVDINITGTLNVLEYCRKNQIKKIITTTSYADVRNLWSDSISIEADVPRSYSLSDDHSVYVITKNAASDLIVYYNNCYGMRGCVFRLPPVYGVGPHSGLFINGKWNKSGFQVFVEKAMRGEPITIFGNKDVIRDIVYVEDVCQAFIKALNSNNASGVYNITSGQSSSLESQVKDIIEIFSSPNNVSKILYDNSSENRSKSNIFDISKARNDFGYEPEFVPFKKLVQAYKDELDKNKVDHLSNQYHE